MFLSLTPAAMVEFIFSTWETTLARITYLMSTFTSGKSKRLSVLQLVSNQGLHCLHLNEETGSGDIKLTVWSLYNTPHNYNIDLDISQSCDSQIFYHEFLQRNYK